MRSNSSFEKVISCDLCGLAQTQVFLQAPDRNFHTGFFTYIQCRHCQLVWLSPRPTKQTLDRYYPQSYSAFKPQQKINKFQRLIRQIIKDYPLLSRFLVKDQLFFWKGKGKLLDVGSGSGHYLRILQSWGWQTYGVDINKDAVSKAKRVGIKNIYRGNIHSVHFKNNYFTLVRLSHVLEHVQSAKKELREVKRILKPHGHVVIMLPNIDSFFFKIFRSYWFPLEAPRHFYQFSPATITKLLTLTGFRDIEIRYNQSPYPVIWSLLYLLGFTNVQKRYGPFVYPLGLVFRIFNFLKSSDVLEITARKGASIYNTTT